MATSQDPRSHKANEVPPDYDTEPLSRTSSQSAASLSNTSALPLASAFTPTKHFFIHAHGIPVLRIPGPSHDTTIKVSSSTGRTVLTSERPSRWSAMTSLHSSPSGETL